MYLEPAGGLPWRADGQGNAFDIAPDGTFWFATGDGVIRWGGQTFERWGTENSPLPFPNVPSVSVRRDGLLGLSAIAGTGSGACVTIDGDGVVGFADLLVVLGNWT